MHWYCSIRALHIIITGREDLPGPDIERNIMGKWVLIIVILLIITGITLRFIKTKKEGDTAPDGHIVTDMEAENSNLLFQLLNKVGFPK